jgi:hypothetical protein
MSSASSKTLSASPEDGMEDVGETHLKHNGRDQHSDLTSLNGPGGQGVTTLSAINESCNSSTAEPAGSYDPNEAQPHPFEQRFIRDADFSPAPFTMPHYISLSRSAPFAGPQTVIEIPFGPDLGSFIHLPCDLSTEEIELAELAIFWLWTGKKSDTGSSTTKTIDTPPATPSCHLTGPPEFPYPLTQSTLPPFPGPRTCIHNAGKHLMGWILHVPRLLSVQQIAHASLSLRNAANGAWGRQHDPEEKLAVWRSAEQADELMAELQKQGHKMTLLRDVVGLDFEAQDGGEEGVSSTWVKGIGSEKGGVVCTPVKTNMPPTPPPTDPTQMMRGGEEMVVLPRDVDVAEFGQDLTNLDEMEASPLYRKFKHTMPRVSGDKDVEQSTSQLTFPAPGTMDITPVGLQAIEEVLPSPHSRRINIISTTCQYLYLAIPSFILSFLVFTTFLDLQGHLIRPSHIVAFLNAIPERRNAIVLLVLIALFAFVPSFCLVLEDSRRLKCFVVLVVVGSAGWWGATQALGKDVFDMRLLY